MPAYAFLHVPKTAGLALRAALESNFGKDAVGPQLSASPRMTAKQASVLESFRILTGHISIASHQEFFPERRILTILRDPIDRCLSSYWFHRSMDPSVPSEEATLARQYSIEEHFSLDPAVLPIARAYVNRMTRQLGSHILDFDCDMEKAFDRAKETLEIAMWVGFHSTLENDLARLRDFSDFSELPALSEINKTKNKKPASTEAYEKLYILNKWDISLYDWACCYFSQSVR